MDALDIHDKLVYRIHLSVAQGSDRSCRVQHQNKPHNDQGGEIIRKGFRTAGLLWSRSVINSIDSAALASWCIELCGDAGSARLMTRLVRISGLIDSRRSEKDLCFRLLG